MKILILGNMRSGKDTLAELLNEYFGMTYRSSSEMANELFIYDTIKDEYGYQSIEECFEDRVNHRSLWYKLICFFNKEDKAKLAKAILKENDCYVGMRDLEEFEASKHLFDIIIWVDASKRLGNSEITNKISIEDAHIVVHNNGTFEEFQEKAKVIGKLLFKK
jgi:dephospho-CoA kinase